MTLGSPACALILGYLIVSTRGVDIGKAANRKWSAGGSEVPSRAVWKRVCAGAVHRKLASADAALVATHRCAEALCAGLGEEVRIGRSGLPAAEEPGTRKPALHTHCRVHCAPCPELRPEFSERSDPPHPTPTVGARVRGASESSRARGLCCVCGRVLCVWGGAGGATIEYEVLLETLPVSVCVCVRERDRVRE